MEENDVKSTCSRTKLNLWLKVFYSKIWNVVNFFIESPRRRKKIFQNLTRYIFFKSKSDALYFFSIRNLKRNEVFNRKSSFLKKHDKGEICPSHGVKWTKTWFFQCGKIFKIWHVEKFFDSKSNALYFFQIRTWCVVKLLNQNMTCCKFSILKSNTL